MWVQYQDATIADVVAPVAEDLDLAGRNATEASVLEWVSEGDDYGQDQLKALVHNNQKQHTGADEVRGGGAQLRSGVVDDLGALAVRCVSIPALRRTKFRSQCGTHLYPPNTNFVLGHCVTARAANCAINVLPARSPPAKNPPTFAA